MLFGVYNGGNSGADYSTSTTLAHEMGHNFGLIHTYTGGNTSANCTTNGSDPFYLDDIYGLPAPGNCPHNISWPCGNQSITNKIENNMLGGNQCADYFSPKQIGTMHRSLKYMSSRNYLKECYYDTNNPLNITSSENWNFDVLWDRDIVVNSGATLTLNCKLSMPQTSSITVKAGGILEIDGEITNNCDGGWDGEINVEPGGTLRLQSNADITFVGVGKIDIQAANGVDGNFIYEDGAKIYLDGADTKINIDGLLYIDDGATFTFNYNGSAHGYVRLGYSTHWPSSNVTCGVGSSFQLTGNNMHSRVLVIDQETFHGPAALDKFIVTDGTIEFGAGCRIQADGGNTIIQFTNDIFTSISGTYNGHRGLHLYGQPNVTIESCIFQYGQYGVFAFLTYGGVPLNLTTCSFFKNDIGFWANDKGFNLYQCYFWNNGEGVHAQYMSFGSLILGGTFGSPFVGNSSGIDFRGYSSSSLFLDDPYIQANEYGVTAEGIMLKAKCGFVGMNTTGFNMLTNSTLIMDNSFIGNNPANVTAFANGSTIKCTNANDVRVEEGANELTPAIAQAAHCIEGSLMVPFTTTMVADNNKWNWNGSYSSSDVNLVDISSNQISISDQYPQSNIDPCGQAIPLCPNPPCDIETAGGENPDYAEFSSENFNGFELKEEISEKIAVINSTDPNNYLEIVENLYNQLVDYSNSMGEEDRRILDFQYKQITEALGYAFKYGQITEEENKSELSTVVSHVLEIQEIISDFHFAEGNNLYGTSVGLDKVQILRLAGRRDLAIVASESLLSLVSTQQEADAITHFQCIMGIEQSVLDGEILISEFNSEELLGTCNGSQLKLARPVSQKLSSEDFQITITPNPAISNLTISTNIENF